MQRIYLLIISLIAIVSSVSASVGDDTQISLLTVMPRSNAVYTVYGHTALRVRNISEGIDVVFNYGTFDFDKPGFMFRFVKGETDYFLSASDYRYFEYAYTMGGSKVVEQVLDIPEQDREAVLNFLRTNVLPQNATYRYNYFFDNCVTRPRDIIERFCGGHLNYPAQESPVTFRDLVHECVGAYPWMQFGIDLIIGSGADSLISKREEMFLPIKLMQALEKTTVSGVEGRDPYSIVLSQQVVIDTQTDETSAGGWSSPMKLGIVLLIHTLVFAICGYIWKRDFRVFFGLIFLEAFLAGCIVFFLSFFSSHPCVSHNWNLVWLHPFHLIAVIGYFFKKTYPMVRWYHAINFVLLCLLLLAWYLIPQKMDMANIPYIFCLLIGSGHKLLLYKRTQI